MQPPKTALSGLVRYVIRHITRPVTDAARSSFDKARAASRAPRLRKLAVYAAVIVLPGGLIALLLHKLTTHRWRRNDA
ncbi:hypothetical protein [Paraburkholderia sp.]|uniref:hypothetical protein n=1 Tax=Paraburkholderia sp. TaxID=1926495 RepID=UPI0025CFE37C|nr:hypothetical protein [Paraburkholderia sp.]